MFIYITNPNTVCIYAAPLLQSSTFILNVSFLDCRHLRLQRQSWASLLCSTHRTWFPPKCLIVWASSRIFSSTTTSSAGSLMVRWVWPLFTVLQPLYAQILAANQQAEVHCQAQRQFIKVHSCKRRLTGSLDHICDALGSLQDLQIPAPQGISFTWWELYEQCFASILPLTSCECNPPTAHI